MGALSDLGDDTPEPGADLTGQGKRLVHWWRDVADDDDRALLRGWIEGHPQVPYHVISERLTAAGFPISGHTIMRGVRILRRTQWET